MTVRSKVCHLTDAVSAGECQNEQEICLQMNCGLARSQTPMSKSPKVEVVDL